ncbi:hypothetical protein [Gallaecimonas mangrovi]|uniref:hypothetical protein n=1 Tax=Gallaecimonas mangrovi TaxID=2291597 RepID=UPI000E1FBCE7|nr:hypothetical protein [Gallaecimonas mangrovi]
MKRWFWLLLFPILAQASAVDDLHQAMAHRSDPHYRSQLKALIGPAVAEAEASHNPLVLGDVLYIKANVESRIDRDYQQSLQTLEQAAKAVAKQSGDQALAVQMKIWIEQGSLNQYLSHFDQAESYFRFALDKARQQHAAKAEAMALYRIGYLKYRQNDIVQALSYLDEASLRLLHQDDPALRLDILATKGRIFRLNHAYDKALDYLQRALVLAQQQGNNKKVPDLLVGIAVTYQEMGDSNSALLESMHALDLYHQQNRQLSEGKALINIASIYLKDPDHRDKAREFLDRAVTLYQQNKVDFYLGTALSMRAELLSNKQQAISDLNQALVLLSKRNSVSDWQEKEKANKRLANLYEALGKKGMAIAALRQAMALQEKLANDDIKDGRQAMERLTEQLNQSERLRQSESGRIEAQQALRTWQLSGSVTAVVLLLALLMLLWLYRHKQQQDRLLAEQAQQLTTNPGSLLPNQLGLVRELPALLEAIQLRHNQSRESGLEKPEPLVLLSFSPAFINQLPLLAGIDESQQLLRRYIGLLDGLSDKLMLKGQVSDEHLLLVLQDEATTLPELYQRLAEITARFVSSEGLEDVRVAVGFNLAPTIQQRASALAISAQLELARFTLAQAQILANETRQSSWVSIQALELAPPSLLDAEQVHPQLLHALDRGLLQLRSGH